MDKQRAILKQAYKHLLIPVACYIYMATKPKHREEAMSNYDIGTVVLPPSMPGDWKMTLMVGTLPQLHKFIADIYIHEYDKSVDARDKDIMTDELHNKIFPYTMEEVMNWKEWAEATDPDRI